MEGHIMRSAIGVLAMSLTILAAPALASERDATQSERQAVVKHLSKLGYKQISDVDVVNGRFEVDARSKAGTDVDLVLDMKTLNVIRKNPS
jgi:hypothetical protein